MNENSLKQTKLGVVEKISSDDTVSVSVESLKKHAKYEKRIRVSKKYLAHSLDSSKLRKGMKVKIQSCRPLSKRKSWFVAAVIGD